MAGLSSNENMVFHCHGRWDRPRSIVASEEDYQKWYLAPRSDGLAFQHSMDLLFSSNPLLFVGYGLGDEDLLRPLRVLGARDPHRKHARPIFVLMALDMDDPEHVSRAEMLYDRYGVQVVRYAKTGADDHGLSKGLKAIEDRWRQAADEWVRKAPPREPVPLVSFESGRMNKDLVEPVRVPARSLSSLGDEILKEKHRVLGLVGPPGSSKTFHAVGQIVKFEEHASENLFPDGIYYWNAHYANEALTNLDRMERYLRGPGERSPGSVFERLEQALETRDCLVVIDGCERFMRPTESPLIGRPIDRSFEKLFGILERPNSKATVLLVGRLWPDVYKERSISVRPSRARDEPSGSNGTGSAEDREAEQQAHLIQMPLEPIHLPEAVDFWTTELDQEEPSAELRRVFSALCAVLEGHNFALYLCFRLIEDVEDPSERLRSARTLQRALVGSRPDRRVGEVVRQVLDRLNDKTSGLAEPLLRLMTTSLNAMVEHSVGLCLEIARGDRVRGCEGDATTLEEILELLDEYKLLVKMTRASITPETPPNRKTYTVHASLRSLFYTTQRGLPIDNLPTFSIAGLASGGVDVDPRQTKFHLVTELFHRIIEDGERALETGDRQKAVDLCRDAYGVVRARMGATTVPRWARFGDYAQLGLRLIHFTKALARANGTTWSQRDSAEHAALEERDGPLYVAELTWLYNDVAVALGFEGAVYDAIPTFMLALDFARMIEPTGVGGPHRIQILLNLTQMMIEKGQLRAAESYLKKAGHMNNEHDDPDFAARILGYEAFVDHLRGNLKDAAEKYNRSIKLLREVPNLRARSYFYRRRAGLWIHMRGVEAKGLELAEVDIRSASILAGEGHFPDLQVEAQIAEGVLFEAQGKLSDSRLHLNSGLVRARRIGSRRLEAEAYCRLARLAMNQGDLDGARRNATRSIQIANDCGLALRRTHGLLILGLATVKAGHRDLGIAYLTQASAIADRQQYWIRQREAAAELQRLEADRDELPGRDDGGEESEWTDWRSLRRATTQDVPPPR